MAGALRHVLAGSEDGGQEPDTATHGRCRFDAREDDAAVPRSGPDGDELSRADSALAGDGPGRAPGPFFCGQPTSPLRRRAPNTDPASRPESWRRVDAPAR